MILRKSNPIFFIFFLLLIFRSQTGQCNETREFKCRVNETPYTFTLLPPENSEELLKNHSYKSPIPADMNNTFAFDICVDDLDHVRPVRLLLRAGMNEIKPITKFKTVEYLEDAIMGDTKHLKIVMPYLTIYDNTPENGNDILIEGYNYNEEESYINVSSTKNKFNPIIGKFELGNLLGQNPCTPNESFRTMTREFHDAKFYFEYCIGQGVGESTRYDILKVVISRNGQEKVLEGRDYLKNNSFFRYRHNHHNACDSFSVAIPEWNIRYGLTTPPCAGCGTSVEGAPPFPSFYNSKSLPKPEWISGEYSIYWSGPIDSKLTLKDAKETDFGHYLRLY